MRVVYIVNEFWLYLTMLRCSVTSLRKHNHDIPIDIVFVSDGNRDSRDVGGITMSLGGVPRMHSLELPSFCKSMGLNLVDVGAPDLGEENGYASAQRVCLNHCSTEKTLLLDADTFVFGDVAGLFGSLDGCHFVADKNTFGERGTLDYGGRTIRPFNSGVVLWGDGLLREYAASVGGLCHSLKNGSHALSGWLRQRSSTDPPQGREELACSIFVLDRGLRFRYFQKQFVQTENFLGGCVVYHTLTQNWPQSYFRFRSVLEPKESRVMIGRRVVPAKQNFT